MLAAMPCNATSFLERAEAQPRLQRPPGAAASFPRPRRFCPSARPAPYINLINRAPLSARQMAPLILDLFSWKLISSYSASQAAHVAEGESRPQISLPPVRSRYRYGSLAHGLPVRIWDLNPLKWLQEDLLLNKKNKNLKRFGEKGRPGDYPSAAQTPTAPAWDG